jgi:hypothetical protein
MTQNAGSPIFPSPTKQIIDHAALTSAVHGAVGALADTGKTQTFLAKQIIDLGSGSGGILHGSFLAFVAADAVSGSISHETYGTVNGVTYSFYNVGGTKDSPSATANASGFLTVSCRGHDGSSTTGTKGSFGSSSGGVWSGTSTPIYWYWNGCKTGATSSIRFMTLSEGEADFPNGSVNVASGYGFKVAGTKVVDAQASAIADISTADATDLASAITLANANKAKINSVLAMLRTHGLIAT